MYIIAKQKSMSTHTRWYTAPVWIDYVCYYKESGNWIDLYTKNLKYYYGIDVKTFEEYFHYDRHTAFNNKLDELLK